MKAFLQRKWFRRSVQTLLVLVSLFVLATVFMNWRGARLKREVLAELKADGRPTSMAELLVPLPPDDENFAMVPILLQARDEWWNDDSAGVNRNPRQARVRLHAMGMPADLSTQWSRFPRGGEPDFSYWKKSLNLEGSPAACLAAYNQRHAAILEELHAGMTRPRTVSPMLHRLMEKPNHPNMNGGYLSCLGSVAVGLGFRAELALAADQPEVAHESLLIAIRVAELIGVEGFMLASFRQEVAFRSLQPTLARGLESGKWSAGQIASIRAGLRTWDPMGACLSGLDLENLGAFAWLDELRKNHRDSILTWWNVANGSPVWKRCCFSTLAAALPTGWFDENAALLTREGLHFRRELGEERDLRKWVEVSDRLKPRRMLSPWDRWMRPIRGSSFGSHFKAACQHETGIRLAVLACDLEIYRLEHGRYPEELRQIGTDGIGDPMATQPFRYQTTDAGYTLYSVGADGRDDGGTRTGDARRDPDWTW